MKKQVSRIALGLSLLSFGGFAQQNFQLCNTVKAMEEYFANNPEAKKSYEAHQKALQDQLNNPSAAKAMAFTYTIPVIVHVLHQGGSENVTDAQVISAINSINDDFAATTPDFNTIALPFKNLYINSDIRLELAKKDLNGNGITGIEHLYDTRTDWQQSNTNFYTGLTWNPTKYLNIIVVRDIIPQGPISGGVVGGYTYKPGTWGSGAAPDAIVVRSTFISGSQVRGITHEIGHWFNLSHTFGNTNNPGVTCGDDGISDTPPTKGNFSSCPSSASGNACAVNSTTAYAAGQMNTENIMDYSTCPKNFTAEQTGAMRNALASSVSGRSNLWQPANLSATGTDGTPVGSFPPKAEFLSTNGSYTVCAGGSLSLKDFSYNGVITAYQWSADNGAAAANPTIANTSISFPNVGVTSVTLTVSNAGGTSVKSRNVYVIDGTANLSGPHVESFENVGVPQNWNVVNNNPGTSGWEQTYAAAYDGVGCFMIDGSLSGSGHQDVLETPMFDLQSVPDPEIEFAISYAQKSGTHNDALKVQASQDCGGTWQDIASLGAGQMQANTGGVTATSFTPVVKEEWKTYKLSNYSAFYSFINSQHVRLRFTFIEGTAGSGNNIFLDAINIYSRPTSIAEFAKTYGFNVYPNPATGEANIHFKLNENAAVKVTVMNVLGQEVINLPMVNLVPGEQNIPVNSGNVLPEGAYFVNVSINGKMLTTKLLVN